MLQARDRIRAKMRKAVAEGKASRRSKHQKALNDAAEVADVHEKIVEASKCKNKRVLRAVARLLEEKDTIASTAVVAQQNNLQLARELHAGEPDEELFDEAEDAEPIETSACISDAPGSAEPPPKRRKTAAPSHVTQADRIFEKAAELGEEKALMHEAKEAAERAGLGTKGAALQTLLRRLCKHSEQEARQLEEKVDTWSNDELAATEYSEEETPPGQTGLADEKNDSDTPVANTAEDTTLEVPANAGAAVAVHGIHGNGERAADRAVEDAEAIRKGFHPNFIGGEVLDALWRYTLTRAPYHVHLRKQPVKSRPKINYGVSNENGEYGLYRWGQEKRDWHRVEDMPPELLAVVDEIVKVFGVRPNHAIATYYHNGKEQWIPVHQDKAVSIGSKGGVESQTTIFNLSLGAVRPFIITTLACLGEKERGKLEIVDEFPMQFGDLYAMTGDINSRFGHCVAKDPSVQDLRVSYVFRCVTKDLVHPTQRYYREMDKTGRRIPLPEPEAEPLVEGETAPMRASEMEVCAYLLPSVATWWLPLPTKPAGSEEQTEGNQPATTAAPASKRMRTC